MAKISVQSCKIAIRVLLRITSEYSPRTKGAYLTAGPGELKATSDNQDANQLISLDEYEVEVTVVRDSE